MDIQVDIWVRGDNHATTAVLAPLPREPHAWTDADMAMVLAEMLRALARAKHGDSESERPVALRGFSWIVNPFESGGVVIALELGLGAIVAGPFDISEPELSAKIQRAIASSESSSDTVH